MPAFSVRTNPQATAALMMLNRVTAKADGVHQRVNTGLAVTSAKDDAATFAISLGVRSQLAEVRAVRDNLSSARSLLSVAQAGAEQVHALLSDAMTKRLSLEGERDGRTVARLAGAIEGLLEQAERAADAARFQGVNLLKGDSLEIYTGRSSAAIAISGNTLSLNELGLAGGADPDAGATFGADALRSDAPVVGTGTAVTSVSLGGGDPDDVQMLLHGTKWGGAAGTGVSLDYSFYDAGVSQYSYGPEIGNSPYELSAGLKTAVRDALQRWGEVSGLSFTEVADTPTTAGELRFGGSSEPPTAWAYLPWPGSAAAGDVWFGDYFRTSPSAPQTYTYLTAIHEIGHALGLKHPHPGPYAGSEHDQLQWSVMSYRDFAGDDLSGYSHSPYPTTPMVADVAAIQYLYGANMGHAAGDTVYQWGVGAAILETIWDGGGTDIIDWSNQSTDAVIDLNDGAYSQLGPDVWADGVWLADTVGIAYGAVIENAAGGSGADDITGNEADNVLTGNGGDDAIDGGAGDDTAVFSGDFADHAVTENGSQIIVVGPDGTDTLTGIETLRFDDQTVSVSDLFGAPPPPPPPPPPPDPDPDPDDPPAPEVGEEGGDGGADDLDSLPSVADLDAALAAVRSAQAALGVQDSSLKSRAEFAETLIGNLATGLGILVDADMAAESANLTALETRRLLALQALALANARPAAILTLFRS